MEKFDLIASFVNSKIKYKKTVFVTCVLIIFAIIIFFYNFVFTVSAVNNKFAYEMINRSSENSIFSIKRVLIFSNAKVIDYSHEQSLENISISQYSDISIYLDNKSEDSALTYENTVKELYIDNISIKTNSDIGTKILNYKNPLVFGKYMEIGNASNNRIDFKIINTNEEMENTNYSDPVFYTDCSNPITLGYLNKDLVTDYSISNLINSVSFNGKVLKDANINLDDINYKLNFTIHIINNLNQHYSYTMDIDFPFDEDFYTNGYSYKGETTTGSEYRFLRN